MTDQGDMERLSARANRAEAFQDEARRELAEIRKGQNDLAGSLALISAAQEEDRAEEAQRIAASRKRGAWWSSVSVLAVALLLGGVYPDQASNLIGLLRSEVSVFEGAG